MNSAVQKHLKQVYLTLGCLLISAAVGVYLHLILNIGGFLTTIAGIGAWLFFLLPLPINEGTWLKWCMAAALLNGATLGPLVELVVSIDPSILVSALVDAVLIFVCFSTYAIMAQRRDYLLLGEFLAFALSILVWSRLTSSIFGTSEIFLGFVVCLGYTIFVTQMIIVEKAHVGNFDYIIHALALFTIFLAVFGRILMILTVWLH